MARLFAPTIVLLTVACLSSPANAQNFLRHRKADTREEVEASLLDGLAANFRAGATKDNILMLEKALQPMYAVVPQNEDGSLSHAVVRYVLHRFFVQRGWFIRGLEPSGGAQNASEEKALQELQEWVPSFLQNFLEQLSGGRGLSLRELAVLAATLEDLIHKEALQRLEQAYSALHLPLDTRLDKARTREVLEVYMMIFQLGGDFNITEPAQVRRAHVSFTEKVKDWTHIQSWMSDIQEQVHPLTLASAMGSDTLDFADAGQVVEAIGKQYGTYNEQECASLKSELLGSEAQKAGRVRLSEFYKKGLKGVFSFTEKIEYLRVLGALDESDPTQPHVIVPNYVAARPNCLVASGFYAICCRNECEDLMSSLERSLGEETAVPEQIIEIITSLSSDTVDAPRTLPATLINRLHSIAKNNGGHVPLHSRLFAQWMHHAYPRECPYPHGSGIVNPQTPNEWMQETGQESSQASEEEMLRHVNNDTCAEGDCMDRPLGSEARQHHHFEENELPWDETEELLMPQSERSSSRPSMAKATTQKEARGPLRTILYFAMLPFAAWAFKSMVLTEGFRGFTVQKKVSSPQVADFYKIA